MPIKVPQGVQVDLNGPHARIKGPKGELERTFRSEMTISLQENVLKVDRPTDTPQMRALHGLTRSLLNSMVVGVSKGFEKVLEVQGVGYRPEMDGTVLVLNVGFSHPVRIPPPKGISFDVDQRVRSIRVLGCDKELVGQVAADIRKVRPPEPYKGKGIRYLGERVRHKAGKAGKVV